MKITLTAAQLANFDPAAFAEELIAAMGSNFGISRSSGNEFYTTSSTDPNAVQFQSVLDAHLLAAPARLFKKQEAHFNALVSKEVEKVATRRGYDSGVSCASYAASTIPAYKSDAAAFIAWRDAVWSYCTALLNQVQAGTAPMPTDTTLLAGLPPFTAW